MAFTQSPWDQAHAARRKRPQRATKTFSDEACEFALTLTLEGLDELTLGTANDLYDELVERYLVGKPGQKPQPLLAPTLPPERVPMSRDLAQKLAMLRAMERPHPDHPKDAEWKPASELDWIGVAVVFPNLWREILAWANTLGADAGNASTAATSATPSS